MVMITWLFPHSHLIDPFLLLLLDCLFLEIKTYLHHVLYIDNSIRKDSISLCVMFEGMMGPQKSVV